MGYFNVIATFSVRIWGLKTVKSSLLAKGTQSTSFLTCVRNKVDLESLACEDEGKICDKNNGHIASSKEDAAFQISFLTEFFLHKQKWLFYQGDDTFGYIAV